MDHRAAELRTLLLLDLAEDQLGALRRDDVAVVEQHVLGGRRGRRRRCARADVLGVLGGAFALAPRVARIAEHVLDAVAGEGAAAAVADPHGAVSVAAEVSGAAGRLREPTLQLAHRHRRSYLCLEQCRAADGEPREHHRDRRAGLELDGRTRLSRGSRYRGARGGKVAAARLGVPSFDSYT